MRWKQFLTPVNSVTVEEAREFMEGKKEGEYTLLDVRQPQEFRMGHIPGAKLIPVSDLTERQEELDREKPIVVYCAVGGRSRLAAQMLAGRGFENILNMKGGIEDWKGNRAIGPYEPEPVPFDPGAAPQDMLIMAYGLEEGLRSYYESLSSRTADSSLSDFFSMLSGLESKHKEIVLDLFTSMTGQKPDPKDLENAGDLGLIEGGYTTDELIDHNRELLKDENGALELAMSIEIQALDLYLRMAEKSRDTKARDILLAISTEERSHIRRLGDLIKA